MLQQHLDVAITAAKAAGEVILPYFRTALQIETKADQSPVTAADRAGEQVIVELLRQYFPDYGVLGEEFGAQPGTLTHGGLSTRSMGRRTSFVVSPFSAPCWLWNRQARSPWGWCMRPHRGTS